MDLLRIRLFVPLPTDSHLSFLPHPSIQSFSVIDVTIMSDYHMGQGLPNGHQSVADGVSVSSQQPPKTEANAHVSSFAAPQAPTELHADEAPPVIAPQASAFVASESSASAGLDPHASTSAGPTHDIVPGDKVEPEVTTAPAPIVLRDPVTSPEAPPAAPSKFSGSSSAIPAVPLDNTEPPAMAEPAAEEVASVNTVQAPTPAIDTHDISPSAPTTSVIPETGFAAPEGDISSASAMQDAVGEDVVMSDEVPVASAPMVPPTAEPLSNAGEHPRDLLDEIRAKADEVHPLAAPTVQFQEQSRAEPAQSYEGPMDINAAQLKFAQSTLKSLKGRREALAFLKPVDPIALGIPQYHQIVTKPMDFGTIDIKLALTALVLKPNSKPGDKAKQAGQFNLDPSQDVYKRISEFDADVRQVFYNCATFNGTDSPYTENARILEAAFDKYMKDVPPASQPAEVAEARVRRPSNPVPTIRRSESDVGGRPKREIHPPPPKDLPYSNESQSSTSEMRKAAKRKAAKKGGKMTAREEAYWAKVAGEELRYCTRVIDDLLKPTHEAVAWVFYDIPSMDFDWAPVYFEMIKKPTSLKQIQKNIRAGKYADADDFDADMQLLIQNCFTFNPPGSDVYIMGEKLKKVYEDKMQRKPVPPPMVADYEESDVDDDDEDDDDGVTAEFLATLQEQIAQLSGTLAMLEGNKTPQSAALIANTKAMIASLQESYASSGTKKSKKGGMKRKASDAGLRKKSKAKSVGSPGAAGATADYLPPKKPKTAAKKKSQQMMQQPSPSSSKKVSSRKDSDEDIRNVTYEQKEELAAKITELSEERLDGAIRIINEDKQPSQNDEEEIELDIDELSPKTLYKLYKYVVRPKKPVPVAQKGNGKSAPLDGRKRGTGGIKKKNLDEGEEAERIARLQQQLEQFGNPDASVSARGHDDLVHSESSSDESASDSDSD